MERYWTRNIMSLIAKGIVRIKALLISRWIVFVLNLALLYFPRCGQCAEDGSCASWQSLIRPGQSRTGARCAFKWDGATVKVISSPAFSSGKGWQFSLFSQQLSHWPWNLVLCSVAAVRNHITQEWVNHGEDKSCRVMEISYSCLLKR